MDDGIATLLVVPGAALKMLWLAVIGLLLACLLPACWRILGHDMPGKRLIGIRLVSRRTGEAPGPGREILRAVVFLAFQFVLAAVLLVALTGPFVADSVVRGEWGFADEVMFILAAVIVVCIAHPLSVGLNLVLAAAHPEGMTVHDWVAQTRVTWAATRAPVSAPRVEPTHISPFGP